MKFDSASVFHAIRDGTPAIGPVGGGVRRPFWSVMIPTYNCGDYLRRTLAGVLSQDPGPDAMQIEVVDGCSTKDDPQQVVEELGAGRVTFHRLSANRGASHTFNTCVERSRGHWIHILHGDDVVLPGFYAAYQKLIDGHPDLAMVCGRFVRIDEQDRRLSVGGVLPPPDMDIVDDFLVRQAGQNSVAFPSVVVARRTYERAGGYSTYFQHVQDMDMWFRAGLTGQVGCVAEPYCGYRHHAQSDTSQVIRSARNIQEMYALQRLNAARLRACGVVVGAGWDAELAGYAEGLAWRLDSCGDAEGAQNQARWAWALGPSGHRLRLLMKTWAKYHASRFRGWVARPADLLPRK